MAFNQAFGTSASEFLNNYLQQPTFDNSQAQAFDSYPDNQFLIAGTTPKNRWYSVGETQDMYNKGMNVPSQGFKPMRLMRRGIDDAVINTGNAFGQDWSGYLGTSMGAEPRPDYKGNRRIEY